MQTQLLTLEEVAATLRLRPRTVQELIREGRLTRIRPTGRRLTRFDSAQVQALIEAGREQGRPAA
jgi:excisionase family DNA binding protein